MAFGLSPKYMHEVYLENFSNEQFLIISLEAAKILGWNIGQITETGFNAYTKSSLSSWNEEILVRIDNGFAKLKSTCLGQQLMDWGKNKKNIEKFTNTINEIKGSFSTEELSNEFEKLKSEHNFEQEQSVATALKPTEKITGFLGIFKPTEGYFITPILIDLNIAIFILMVISGVSFFLPDTQSLISWGANFRPLTLEGQWWRLLTNCFLHIGIVHLLMNMYALIYIGLLLEPYLGKARFAAAYLLTGLAASIVSLWWHDLTVSAGASGAIFGMYGVFIAMLTTNLIEKSARKSLLTSIAIFAGYNLLNGMKAGIDNAAHVGGLLSGVIIGYAFVPALKKPQSVKLNYSIIGALTLLIIAVAAVACKVLPNDIGIYTEKMNSFVSTEQTALAFYRLPVNTPKEKILAELKNNGINGWNENIKLLNNVEKLNLPSAIHQRNQKLLFYCNLRLKTYNLLYKTIDQDTDEYRDSVQLYNQQVENIINDLQNTK
ncbi:MAG: rhomboid family intramembrane serine protease [Ginsengibacter sp.]